MSSCDDIRSVSAAFAQPVLQQPNKTGRCGLGSATDGEERPTHPHLLFCNCQEETAPRWHHPAPFGIILHWRMSLCTGWHLKNHQLLMEIVKRCSGEDLLFCSLPYPSHWQRKNNTCSRFMEWLVFRNIFDHKIKSNHSFEKIPSQTTIRLLYRSQMKLHSNNSLLSLRQFSPWKNNWSY